MPFFIHSSRAARTPLRTLDVRPDDTDARDYIFQPSLDLLPPAVDRRGTAPVLDQGAEGACVGFALATVINVSLARRGAGPERRGRLRPRDRASPRMLYEMARRHDEWSGESYEGTSLRGAMKGWHKHGVTTEARWPCRVRRGERLVADRELTPERAEDALRRPIGAYFRILDSDVSHVQAAVVEGDALLASAWVHEGWRHENLLRRRGLPTIARERRTVGLHAFAVVGYGPQGFVVQNSWGARWGAGGFALLPYDEWFENRQDAWVARPGPTTLDADGRPRIFAVGFAGGPEASRVATSASGLDIDREILPYLVNTGDRGALSSGGTLSTRPDDLSDMAQRVLTAPVLADGRRHVILYAHGGLNREASSAVNAARLWSRARERDLHAYFFIWESGIDESVIGWLRSQDDAAGPARFSWAEAWDAIKHGAGEVVREAQRMLGEKLSPLVREVFWGEMNGRAEGASKPKGGAALFADALLQAMTRTPNERYALHLVAHSAGSIYLGWLYDQWLGARLATQPNVTLGSIHLMAPAITIARARQAFRADGGFGAPRERFVVYALKPADEDIDSIHIYPSSLLTYVADCLESGQGRQPLLGIRRDFEAAGIDFATLVQAKRSRRHGEFDDVGHEIEGVFDAIRPR